MQPKKLKHGLRETDGKTQLNKLIKREVQNDELQQPTWCTSLVDARDSGQWTHSPSWSWTEGWHCSVLSVHWWTGKLPQYAWCWNHKDYHGSVIIILPSVLWRCWLGGRKGIRPVKTEWWGTGMVICLERDANDLHMVQLMPLPPHQIAPVKSRVVYLFGAGLPRLSRKKCR